MEKKDLRIGLIVAVVFAVLITIAYLVAKAIGLIASDSEIERWLNMTVSELKVWQLILIFCVISWLEK